MDGEEPTQATQNVLDPRRIGKQNSGFSDDDISDIICVLYPHSDSARQEVQRLAFEDSPYVIGKDEVDGVEPNYELEDHASHFESNPTGQGSYAILLRLSSRVKDPAAGYAFGRNSARCDVVFANDPYKRVSNIHFRIYVNEYGNVMVADQSTNGTFVDHHHLTSHPKDNTRQPVTRWVLSSGSVIKIYLHKQVRDLTFRVRIPHRDDEYERAYTAKVAEYFARHGLRGDNGAAAAANAAANGGPVDIFRDPGQRPTAPPSKRPETQRKNWNGSGKYNKVGMVGKGAFAVVYKVTGKFDGKPYAAKELEKRRFIKNGVLDQKVENEMKIMERVQHPNIVRYIENFDWDHLLIIIMEYVPGGDLGRTITEDGAFNEGMAQTMASQLLGALEYLHMNNITHRDVKPDNILVSSLEPLDVKLTDFGLSKMVDSEQTFLRTFCGTLLYCAPEVYNEYAEYDDNGVRNRGHKVRRMPGQRYSHAVDIWSLGGVLFFSLTKSPPYPVKSGISYSELLHKIMTTDLDISPLETYGISEQGIAFLSRMLQRRPENRATIAELDDHPWFGGQDSIIAASQSYDEMTDDDELAEYSQKLQLHQQGWDDDRVSASMGEESAEEDGDPGQDRHSQRPQRLFGEVGVSAIGSSGVIPDDFLNLPVSMRETEALGSYDDEAYDSRMDATPAATRTYRPADRQMAGSAYYGQSADQLQSLVEEVASQSLGDHETKAGEAAEPSFYSSAADLTTSKRKPPAHDASDGHDDDGGPGKPVMKRLKSVGNMEDMPADFVEEAKLLACIPQVKRLGSGRQIDEPVDKVVYWEQDRSTWHLDYPEMTQLQHAAFQRAAEDRGEVFGPDKSPLWALAMRHFPPTKEAAAAAVMPPAQTLPAATDFGSKPNEGGGPGGASSYPDPDFPPTAMQVDEASTQGMLPPDAHIVVPVQDSATHARAVGIIESHADSAVPRISFPITEPFVSFGRRWDNTQVFHPQSEARVPKNAFKIMLWRDGNDSARAAYRAPYPWSGKSKGDEDEYAFWISSKATIGIRINGHVLPSDDPKKPDGPSRYWTQIHDGDDVVIWGKHDAVNRTALTFRCFWGASSIPRADRDKPIALAPPDVAHKLDEACHRAERRARDAADMRRRRGEAREDLQRRKQVVQLERERSDAFEAKRREAVEFLQSKMLPGSQGSSSRGSTAVASVNA